MKYIITLLFLMASFLAFSQKRTYEYDELQRLRKTHYWVNNLKTSTVIYTYDAVGNRETKTIIGASAPVVPPDLSIVNANISPSGNISVGGSVNLYGSIKNTGDPINTPFKLKFYLSTDQTFDVADIQLSGIINYTSIGTAEVAFSEVMNLPPSEQGQRYLLYFVDADNTVSNESNETNNVVALPITIVPPCGNIAVSVSTTNANGNTNDGTATAVGSGGTSPYTYLWSNSATTASITGLMAGTYSVSVTDANGCSGNGSGVVGQTEVCNISLSAAITNVSCGAADGAIDLTVTNATSPLIFTWSNSASTEDISSLAQDTYFVNVTDGAGCTASGTYVVGVNDITISTESYYIPLVQQIYENTFSLVETNNFSKIIFNNYYSNPTPIQLKAFDLATNLPDTLQVPLVDFSNYLVKYIASDSNKISLYTNLPGSTGILNIEVDENFNPTLLSNRVVSGVSSVYSSNYFYRFGNKSLLLTAANYVPPLGYLANVTIYDTDESIPFYEATEATEKINQNLIVKDSNNSNRYFIVHSTGTGGHWIEHYENVNNTSTKIATYSLNGQPMRFFSTKTKNYAIVKRKRIDNVFETYIITYDLLFNQLDEYLFPPNSTNPLNIINAVLGSSTSGKPILCFYANNTFNSSYLFRNIIDIENKKLIESNSNVLWPYGLLYSNKYNKFISIRQAQPPHSTATKLDLFQINDGIGIETILNNTPFGQSNGSVDLTIKGGTATFSWSNGATTEDINGLAEGNYSVVITPTNGSCPINRTFQIKTNTAPPAPTLSASPSTTIISGSSVSLTATGCTGAVLWSTGATTATISVLLTSTSSYTATCTYNGYTSNNSSPLTITVISATEPPVVSSNKSSVCVGSSVILTATNCTGTVNWSSGDVGSSITKIINTSSTFSATCTSNSSTSGNSNEVLVSVIANGSFPTALISGNQTINEGQSANLSVALTGTSPWSITVNDASYDNITSSPHIISVSPTATTTYTLSRVENSCGLGTFSGSATVTVITICQLPDLIVEDIKVTKYASDKIYYTVKVKNIGNQTVNLGSFSFSTYGSADANKDNVDVFKHTMFLGGGDLAIGATINYNVSASMNYASNQHYFLVLADNYNMISECEKNNNWGSKVVKPCSHSGDQTLTGNFSGLVATNGKLILDGVTATTNTLFLGSSVETKPTSTFQNRPVIMQNGNCLNVSGISNSQPEKDILEFQESNTNLSINYLLNYSTNLSISIWDMEAQTKLSNISQNVSTTAGNHTLDLSNQNLVSGKSYIVHFETEAGHFAQVLKW